MDRPGAVAAAGDAVVDRPARVERMSAMMPLVGVGPSALRLYGTWSEGKYEYGHNGMQAVAVKRFLWTQPIRSKHGGLEFPLSYFADVAVRPRPVDDLGYLAARERTGLDIMEAMILLALQGTAYISAPQTAGVLKQNLFQVIGEWVKASGPPERWPDIIAKVVDDTFTMLTRWKERLAVIQATTDPAHPDWGLAFEIEPIEPREPAG